MGNVIYLRQHGVRPVHNEPIAAMNITPLIDVMLVLLVMLIITLPMTLHKVAVDLPTGAPPITTQKPVVQRLALSDAGITTWNGVVLNDDALSEKLRAAAIAQDDVQFRTEGNARYERFDQLIALVKRNGVTKIGFVGNSGFAKYD
jgi:biopolymer transport protein ExbD